MASRVHLVRHGEVENPANTVYANLPGWGLSEEGRAQSRLAARYLGRRPLVGIWSSPVERALRTAEAIAARVELPVRVEPELAEWTLMDRWAGVPWEELPTAFPGELESLLDHPTDLPFAPETLEALGRRVADAVRGIEERYHHGEVVFVSHSSPVRAATLVLTGEPLTTFWEIDPPHASVTTLKRGSPWTLETTWAPEP